MVPASLPEPKGLSRACPPPSLALPFRRSPLVPSFFGHVPLAYRCSRAPGGLVQLVPEALVLGSLGLAGLPLSYHRIFLLLPLLPPLPPISLPGSFPMWGWTYVGCGPGVWSCLVLTGRDPACSYVIDFLKRLLFKLPPPLGTGQFTLLKSNLYWRPAVSRDWDICN